MDERQSKWLMQERESDRKCINCEFYSIDHEECRYNAPMPYGVMAGGHDETSKDIGIDAGVFPVVNSEFDWCGRFSHRK